MIVSGGAAAMQQRWQHHFSLMQWHGTSLVSVSMLQLLRDRRGDTWLGVVTGFGLLAGGHPQISVAIPRYLCEGCMCSSER
jgi:hypothetical protein